MVTRYLPSELNTYPLEKFTNAELYYIISSLLGLGDPGFGHEYLYLSFEESSLSGLAEIRFFLTTVDLISSNGKQTEVTNFHLGTIDSNLDDIHVYSGHCLRSEFDLEKSKICASFVSSIIHKKNSPNRFRPLTFIKGVNRILSQPDLPDRKDNDIFKFFWKSPMPDQTKFYFDFGIEEASKIDFSGNYYQIVKPNLSKLGGARVSEFKVSEEDDEDSGEYIQTKVERHEAILDCKIIQRYESGEREELTYPSMVSSSNEDPDKHKSGILETITSTVYALLADLNPLTVEKLLSGETPEELIIHCQEKYNCEFDLNFPSLGTAGAHEIAWQEVFADFNDESWSEDNEE
ncbi:MAG: hypothetical protein JSS79_10270 [Bacteroidetes bacterium]|nr:hypothetical protein [Bacteroidota bacterium]